MDFLLPYYSWIKALHVISVISWMAGLFYLPRLFVHHVERAKGNAEFEDIFKNMEQKLIRLIMNPAMTLTWICGLLMVFIAGKSIYLETWFIIKFCLVCIMTWFHHWCSTQRKKLAKNQYEKSGKYYRLMNEVPTLLMIFIVVLVVVKPF